MSSGLVRLDAGGDDGMAPAREVGRARAPAMPAGTVRPFQAEDAPAVASLFLRTFRSGTGSGAPSAELIQCIRDIFLPAAAAGRPSLVYAAADGSVAGFIGVRAGRYLADGEPVEVSVVGTLMVDRPDEDPMAGARLIRAAATAGQALTLSETANPISQRLWARLGGQAIGGYSLDYIKILRPVGFVIAAAARRLPPVRYAAPLARLLDRVAARLLPQGGRPDGAYGEADIGPAEAARLILDLTQGRRFRPAWDEAEIAARIEHAADKPSLGAFVSRAVKDGRGRPVGLYLYHVRPGGIAQVLNVFARPGREGEVVARLVADAAARGAVAVKGRTEPDLTNAFGQQGALFVQRAALIAHAADKSLIAPILHGDAVTTGLAAETWIRLIGSAWV